MSELQSGQTFADYVIIAKLGEGGMGKVYQAREPALDRLVALKTLRSELASVQPLVSRFKREAIAAAKCVHSGIVQVFHTGEYEGTHYIAMEFIAGESLAKQIKRVGRLPAVAALGIGVAVAQALNYAWQKAQLIHRDVKPDNIFIATDGTVKLGDFGLVKLMNSGLTDTTLTVPGLPIGSPDYISPEQLYGDANVDIRSDIYSLGCTLYHMLTGNAPYTQGTPFAVMVRQITDPPPDIRQQWPDCPDSVVAILEKMLAKKPSARYSNYEVLLQDLTLAQQQLRPGYRPPVKSAPAVAIPFTLVNNQPLNNQPRSARRRRRKTLVVAGSLTGLAVVLVAAGFLLWGNSQPAAIPELPVAIANAPATITNAPVRTSAVPTNVAPVVLPLVGSLEVKSPQAAQVTVDDEKPVPIEPRRVLRWEKLAIGKHHVRVEANGKISDYSVEISADQVATVVALFDLTAIVATKAAPWENSLGMKFVPVPGTPVLFSIWDTRVQDFEAFVNASGYNATQAMYSFQAGEWKQRGDTWQAPGFKQGPTHPVCGVSWEDAKAFCNWLTKTEQANGQIGRRQFYRLPTDEEWSAAVGLTNETGGTPKSKDSQLKDVYPWGTQWPPPPGAGNYAGEEFKRIVPANWLVITGYNDGFVWTSPVGSFAANRHGLFDITGNVWQWCEDLYAPGSPWRVMRGASWHDSDPGDMLSSYRYYDQPGYRYDRYGFRCVLVSEPPIVARPGGSR
ncbi:MAG: bifunctional serine/threonine-protein kinase/formylglycine-generating enzyme family protein [Verrucomicrobiota bacterium]